MHLWIGVENFAKIEKAKICVDNYTLLVGPNNSGKTFLMQLVQGLSDKVVDLIDNEAIEVLFAEEMSGYKRYILNESNIISFVDKINEKLLLRKDELVREIFGKDIAIENLFIEAKLERDASYQIDVLNNIAFSNEEVKGHIDDSLLFLNDFLDADNEDEIIAVISRVHKNNFKMRMVAFSSVGEENTAIKGVLRHILERRSLFLPASRTGLMLLYRDFFANKADNAIMYQLKDEKLVEDKERFGGLTQPIYEFLRFLQTYRSDEGITDYFKEELRFFEEKLIEGHISVSKQGTFSYSPMNENDSVPMYLASAMINEVAPMVLALTSGRMYTRLIIDEVEASLHPQKQHELARFLNRLSNNNMSLLFSTHSDTFVSKLNNLYILSEYVKEREDDSILERFNLDSNDLVNTENLFVYEFVLQENGKSVVKEIIPDKKSGYHFDLFTKSTIELYAEASRIGEMH